MSRLGMEEGSAVRSFQPIFFNDTAIPIMKSYPHSLLCLLTCVSLTLTACGKGEILDFRNAQIVNGKVYAANANTPFSGTVTNVPDGKVLAPQDGFGKFASIIPKAMPEARQLNITSSTLWTGSLCDVHIKDGLLDGKASCKRPQSETARYEMTFNAGRLDGKLKAYDPAADNQLVSEVMFKNGEPDGKQEIYGLSSHKLVHVANWVHGTLQGKEEGFDETTGNRVFLATIVNGQYDGKLVRYAPDGKQLIYSATFSQGQLEGVEEAFHPQTGKLTGRAEYVNGKLNGVVKRWDASGTLFSEKAYRDGVEVVASAAEKPESGSAAAASIDACIDGWTAAYRKEKGEDAMIGADQISEWQSWCKAGKRSS